MQIKSVTDNAFARYGKVIEGYDFGPLLGALRKNTTRPHSGVEYVPGFAPLESLDIYAEIRDGFMAECPFRWGTATAATNSWDAWNTTGTAS